MEEGNYFFIKIGIELKEEVNDFIKVYNTHYDVASIRVTKDRIYTEPPIKANRKYTKKKSK